MIDSPPAPMPGHAPVGLHASARNRRPEGPAHLEAPGWSAALRYVVNQAGELAAPFPVHAVVGALSGAFGARLVGADTFIDVAALTGALLGVAAGLVGGDFNHERALHEQRWRDLTAYPRNRALLRQWGITAYDWDEVRALHQSVRRGARHLEEQLRHYCQRHRLLCDASTLEALHAFAHEFCMGFSPLLILRCPLAKDQNGRPVDTTAGISCRAGSTHVPHSYFLVSAPLPDLVRILADMEEGVTPMTAARNHHRPCRSGRLKRLHRSSVSEQPTPDHRAVDPAYAATSPGPVRVTHRRGPAVARSADRPDTPTVSAARAPVVSCPVLRSQLLDAQLGVLGKDSRTAKDVDRIQQELERGRDTSHAIRWLGYRAFDIQMDGLRRRHQWRLLCHHVEGRFRMAGIGNYHASRNTIQWWRP